MTGPLAALGHGWEDLVDRTLSWQAELLNRTARQMADAIDRAAQRDIEGASDWRDLTNRREFPS